MTEDINIRGPWTSQGWVPTWAYIPVHDADGNVVASFYPKAYRISNADTEARARLAAAAPNLLWLLGDIVDCYGMGSTPEKFCEQVRDVIEEARDLIKFLTEA